jgi:hypothetical protein
VAKRKKGSKEVDAKRDRISAMVGHYESGFSTGWREGLEWAIKSSSTLVGMANTEHGKMALSESIRRMKAEHERRYGKITD